MPYLYRHIRLDTNQPFYVGIGSDAFYKRAHSHFSRNNHWKNVVKKTEYSVHVLLNDISWEEACEKEKEFINLYKRVAEGGTLVNITAGGEGLYNPTKDVRQKISKSQLGSSNNQYKKPKGQVWRDAMQKLSGAGNPNYGKKIPDWHKEILKKAQTGRKKSQEEIEKITNKTKGQKRSLEFRKVISKLKSKPVIDTSSNMVYESVTVAAKALNYKRRTLNAWLKGDLPNKSTLRFLQQ